jgi:hypothetical protein
MTENWQFLALMRGGQWSLFIRLMNKLLFNKALAKVE